jgi:hypothetical protein
MLSNKLKSNGAYYEAGCAARLEGKPDFYGCHFGMRSDRERATADFRQGWADTDQLLRQKARNA